MQAFTIKSMPKKKVGSVHTAKNGARYKIMANGQARFISGPTKRKRAKRGGSAMVGGSAYKRKRGGSARVGGGMHRGYGGGMGRAYGGGLGMGKRLRAMNPGVYDAMSAAGKFILH